MPGFAFRAMHALENAGDSGPAASVNAGDGGPAALVDAGASSPAALEKCGDSGMAERIQCVCGGAPGPSGKASRNGIVGLRAQDGGGGWTLVASCCVASGAGVAWTC